MSKIAYKSTSSSGLLDDDSPTGTILEVPLETSLDVQLQEVDFGTFDDSLSTLLSSVLLVSLLS